MKLLTKICKIILFKLKKKINLDKKKIIFKSLVITKTQIKYLILNIKKIFTHKGIYKIKNKNISNIAFIRKN
jgi:hypothetical protein